MSLATYMEKAERAFSGARLLLSAGDLEGACNSAYYAMFDAAHAALWGVNSSFASSNIKTHRGLIAAFGKEVVLGQFVPPELSAALNQVERLRMLADYTGDPLDPADAAWAVEQASVFVGAIKTRFVAIS